MSDPERMDGIGRAWERNRDDLVRYAARLLLDADAARDLVQQTALRALDAASAPADAGELRKWLFRITSNLAIDELRRRGRWSERALLDSRGDAEGNDEFVAASLQLRGSQEMSAIAREHFAFCFSCILRTLEPHRAAALLLVEIYAFTVRETASILGATEAQAKNWLQEARSSLAAQHAARCALISKNGVCYQCSELSLFFNGTEENPVSGRDSLDARLELVRAARPDLNLWHRRLVEVIEERRRAAARRA